MSAVKTRQPNPYPIKERARAFFAGLKDGHPLLEVAFRGLKKPDLPDYLNARYLLRVAGFGAEDSKTAAKLTILLSAVSFSTYAQHCLAIHLAAWDDLTRMQLTSAMPSLSNPQHVIDNARKVHASRVSNFVQTILESGHITDSASQVVFAQMLSGLENAKFVSVSLLAHASGKLSDAAKNVLNAYLAEPYSFSVSASATA